MSVRVFASGDSIIMLPGGTVGMDGGPITIAYLVKRNSTAVNPLVCCVNNGTTASGSFNSGIASSRFQSTGSGNHFYHAISGAADSTPALPVVNADGWVLAVVTKANGSAAPRFHRYVLSTVTMTRANGGTSQADSGTPASSTFRWTFGKDEFTNRFAGKLAVAGVWDVALSDAQVDELYANLRTQDWYNNSAGVPKALWDFNQGSTGTAVTDLTGGGADQTAISGTSVDGADDPVGWTFGVTIPSSGASSSLSGRAAKNAYNAVAASSTDSALVTAVPGKRIRVLSFLINQGDTTPSTVTFNSKGSGAGTAIFAPLKTGANGAAAAPLNEKGWFSTNAGEGLSVTTGAGSTSNVAVTYEVVS